MCSSDLKTIGLAKHKVASELSKIVGQRKDVEIDIADLEERLNHYQEKTVEVQGIAAAREQNYRNIQDLESQLTSLAKRIEKAEFDLGRSMSRSTTSGSPSATHGLWQIVSTRR